MIWETYCSPEVGMARCWVFDGDDCYHIDMHVPNDIEQGLMDEDPDYWGAICSLLMDTVAQHRKND